jgi:hypothetical protein
MEIPAELLPGIDAFRRQSDQGERMTREEAAKIIIRDWLQGQGFMPIAGEAVHPTARKAAYVPTGQLDP